MINYIILSNLGFLRVAFLQAFGLLGVCKGNGEQACSASSLLHTVWQQVGTRIGYSLGKFKARDTLQWNSSLYFHLSHVVYSD